MIFCVLFVGLSVTPARAQEAGGFNKNQSLKVGDKIPEELWHLPLKVVNHPEGKEYIRLSDYRDKKLIILEFWGTWCGSCIAALPLAKNIQHEFAKDLLVIPITFEPADKVKSFVAKNEIARNVNLWSVVEDSTLTGWITKYTYPHFTWIADGKILSHTSESALKVPDVKEYLNVGTIRWVEKVNLDKDGLFLSSLGDLQQASSSFFYVGYLDGAGRGFGAMPFQGNRTNYYFINYSPRHVHEWFLKRLAREHGEILTEIAYAPAFRNSAIWQMYNDGYISLQLIANKELPLDAVFRQFQAMTSSRLELDSDGHYTLSTGVKGAGR